MNLQNLVNAACSRAIDLQVRVPCHNAARRQIDGVLVDDLWAVDWPTKYWNNFVEVAWSNLSFNSYWLLDSFGFSGLDRINFGKYTGKSFNEIADIDPDYILWLHRNNIVQLQASLVATVRWAVAKQNSGFQDIVRDQWLND